MTQAWQKINTTCVVSTENEAGRGEKSLSKLRILINFECQKVGDAAYNKW